MIKRVESNGFIIIFLQFVFNCRKITVVHWFLHPTMKFSHNYTYITFVLSIPLLTPHSTLQGYHRVPDWAPYVLQQLLTSQLFTHVIVCMSMLFMYSSHCFPNCVHEFALCICISIPFLQISSSIQFSRFCIYKLIYNIYFFSF